MTLPTAVIIGAGPAGLTAAYELLQHGQHRVIVLECGAQVGGLSRTVLHHGNRIDIGGHRFFSRSKRVRNWWQQFLPLAEANTQTSNAVMLVRPRCSSILFEGQFFDYPLQLRLKLLKQLSVRRTLQIIFSYLSARLSPITPESHLEAFFINRFGRRLYQLFFQSYTEKVWGRPCDQIAPDWGSQRIKSLSILSLISTAIRGAFGIKRQGPTPTTLIEQFWYPPLGPGQLWDQVANQIIALGGELLMEHQLVSINSASGVVTAIEYTTPHGERCTLPCDQLFSSMPLSGLFQALATVVPPSILAIAASLPYRDFITIGIEATHLAAAHRHRTDNWIYIQDQGLRMGRIQLYHNWSPALLRNPNHVWLGLEYFCQQDDPLWRQSDAELITLAQRELQQLGLCEPDTICDSVVVRVAKAYPGYYAGYHQLDQLRQYLNSFENLYPIGRNGMHRYNNQDHSMLTAMTAVENLIHHPHKRDNLWNINIDDHYHEDDDPADAPCP